MPIQRGSDLRRIGDPPAGLPDPLARYLRDMAAAINSLPRLSAFSADTPNSLVTGLPGDLIVNLASTGTKVWVKTGSGATATTSGWSGVMLG